MKYTYSVQGMTCNGCENSVKQKLEYLLPESSIEVSLETSEIVIKSKEKPSLEQIQKALPEKYKVSTFDKSLPQADIPIGVSKLKQLKPLFLIFAYITFASILMHIKVWDAEKFMLDFMGLFLIVFSFFKFLDLKGFSESFKMYDPLAKSLPIYAMIYPFLEIILGISFLFRFQVLSSAIVTIALLGITTIGVTRVLLQKKQIQCACLGTALKLPMTQATFIENSIMITMGLIMITNVLNF